MSLQEQWSAAKITPPRQTRLASRPRLLAPLHAAAREGQVVLLVAPGGSGKTTLVAEWASQALLPVAWYALDQSDRDTRRMLRGIIAAVERVLPEFVEGARRAMDGGGSEIAALGLLLGALRDTPLALVLDDFHALDDLPEATALWEHLLRYRPPTLCLALLSRTVPILGFAMLAATGSLLGLGRADLGFDGREAADLLAVHGLDTEDAARYAAQSDGWATGVLLFARASPGGMRFLHHRADMLLDQLGAQILAPLPSNLRRFILETAAVGPVTATEADLILERTGSAALFNELLARDLFLARDGTTFRYHDIFADFFTGVLGKEDPERLKDIQRAAALWWIKLRDLPRALTMIAASEDWPLVAATLEEHRRLLWEQRLWGTILTNVDRLPPSYRTARVLALCGSARAERGEYQEALAFADAGKSAAEGDEEWLSPALVHAETLMQAGRHGECVESASAAMAVAKRVSHGVAVSRLLEARGWARLSMGNLEEGRADLLAAVAGHREAKNSIGEGRALYALASLLIEAGRAREGAEYLARAAQLWRQEDNRPMLAHLGTAWAQLHLLLGELEDARERAERAIAIARECGDCQAECMGMIILSDALSSAGQAIEADHYAATTAEMARRLGMDTMLNGALRARVTSALARRDRTGAKKLIEEARPQAVTPVDHALLDLLDGMAALRSRAFGRASVLLERAEERLMTVNHHHQAARACFLHAEALLATGAISKAENALHRMTDLITPLGCEAFLWPMARAARQVLNERHLLRRLRRDSRQLLDRMAGAVPSLTLVLPSGEEDRALALRLSPFGQGRILLSDQQVSNTTLPPKAREALFFAGHAQGTVARASLLEALWEDEPYGPRELWDATRHIRRVLGDHAWTVRRGAYTIALPLVDEGKLFSSDAIRAQAKGPIMERLAAGERAMALIGAGGYLEWCESLWVEGERVRTQGLAVGTALALAGMYEELNRIDDALVACKRAITLEPLEEAPRIALIRLLAGRGRIAAALQEYHDYQVLTREELGTEPSSDLRGLIARLPGA
ncbi:MAG TPA: BTAD domain-containing putative transcriptional regulator [Chloroflexota bacterium]|nr:BTAD domain-containing putative transcriptional regulator [Chloroflexota bacterium]